MTQNHVSGMEASAVSVLKRAVELDQGGRFQESLVCYQEGIQLLIDVLKGLSSSFKCVAITNRSTNKWTWLKMIFPVLLSAVKDDSKRGHFRDKIKGYMDRAEQIKVHVNQVKEGNHSWARPNFNCSSILKISYWFSEDLWKLLMFT